MRRRKDRIGKRKRYQKRRWALWVASSLLAIALVWPLYLLTTNTQQKKQSQTSTPNQTSPSSSQVEKKGGVSTARIMAHGDLLYHDLLYMSAKRRKVPTISVRTLPMLNHGLSRLTWP